MVDMDLAYLQLIYMPQCETLNANDYKFIAAMEISHMMASAHAYPRNKKTRLADEVETTPASCWDLLHLGSSASVLMGLTTSVLPFLQFQWTIQ